MTSPAQGNVQPAEAQQKKTRKLGDYELLSKLGQGAMGSVYLARQISQDRKVALKILPQDLAKDQEFLERFRREARAATRLQHQNIVAAYDIGVADNYNYIAMEYIDGPNLEIALQKKGRFSEEEVLNAARDISGALGIAESHKVVHRDIKPANILVNSQGTYKLTDMGLASAGAGDQRVTMAGFAVGTPFYISPEQARGDLDVDGRADIYSLGATMYHLATGALPFDGNNPVVIMTKHLQEMPPAPHERNASVSKPLSALIMKMMAKDVHERPQNAMELQEDIEKVRKGEMPAQKVARLKAKPAVAPHRAHMKAEPHAVQAPASSPGLLDKILFFVPPDFRIALVAAGGTLLVLVLLYTLLKK